MAEQQSNTVDKLSTGVEANPDEVDLLRSLRESKPTSKLLQYTEERSEHKERVFSRL